MENNSIEERLEEIRLFSAKEARTLVEAKNAYDIDNELREITRSIVRAVQDGNTNISLYNKYILSETKIELAKLGYTITIEPSGYNETCTKISW